MNIKKFKSLILFADKVEIGKQPKDPVLATGTVLINMDKFESAFTQHGNPLKKQRKEDAVIIKYLEMHNEHLFTICTDNGKYCDLLRPANIDLYEYLFT